MQGQLYDMKDPVTAKEKERALLLCEQLNALSVTQKEERLAIAKELFGEIGEPFTIYPGFHCDNGKHIRIGSHAFINYNIYHVTGRPRRTRRRPRSLWRLRRMRFR